MKCPKQLEFTVAFMRVSHGYFDFRSQQNTKGEAGLASELSGQVPQTETGAQGFLKA